ncbi:unnamed protein product [Symbiodinium microadriaticum]|nr:unnamed protein product [Symbiodinium microadriaticum]CAE7829137.1 unnamed protein product [Symbiodinium sp. KB8]
MTKVQRQCFAFLSGSAANTIVVENLGQDRASLKTQEVLEPGQPPRYYLPRDSSWALEDVSDGMFITIGGLLQTIGELVPTSEGDVQAIALSDGDAQKGKMVVLETFWCGVDKDRGGLTKVVSTSKSSITVLDLLTDADREYVDTQLAKELVKTIELDEHQGRRGDGCSKRKSMSVSYAQERLNKNGDIWLKMTFTDLTGQIEVRCGEEPLLELAGLGPGDGAELQRQQMRFVILERASLYIEGRVAPDRNDANTMHLSLVRVRDAVAESVEPMEVSVFKLIGGCLKTRHAASVWKSVSPNDAEVVRAFLRELEESQAAFAILGKKRSRSHADLQKDMHAASKRTCLNRLNLASSYGGA